MSFDDSGSADLPRAPVDFDSGAAAFHVFAYANQHGWGPLLRLGGVYLLFNIVVGAAMLWAVWPFVAFAMALPPGAEPDPGVLFPLLGRVVGVALVAMLLVAVVWSAVEAALLRWLYGRGAGLRFGGVELGLILILILWCLLPLAVFLLPSALAIAVAAAGAAASTGAAIALGVLCGLAFIAAIPIWIAVAARLAPAGALTVRDGRLRVFSAWGASRGRFWPALGAFVIAWLVYIGAYIALQTVMQIGFVAVGFNELTPYLSGAGQPSEPPDPSVILGVLASPGFIVFMAISVLASCALSFGFQAMLAGVNAYLVRRPRPRHELDA